MIDQLKKEIKLDWPKFCSTWTSFEHDANYDTLQLCSPHHLCSIIIMIIVLLIYLYMKFENDVFILFELINELFKETLYLIKMI